MTDSQITPTPEAVEAALLLAGSIEADPSAYCAEFRECARKVREGLLDSFARGAGRGEAVERAAREVLEEMESEGYSTAGMRRLIQALAPPATGAEGVTHPGIPAELDTLLRKWANASARDDDDATAEAWNALLRGLNAWATPARGGGEARIHDALVHAGCGGHYHEGGSRGASIACYRCTRCGASVEVDFGEAAQADRAAFDEGLNRASAAYRATRPTRCEAGKHHYGDGYAACFCGEARIVSSPCPTCGEDWEREELAGSPAPDHPRALAERAARLGWVRGYMRGAKGERHFSESDEREAVDKALDAARGGGE